MSDFSDVRRTYERYHSALAAANAHNKGVVFDALAAAGITVVTVPFDGEGDSGQLEDAHCEPAGFDLGKMTVTIQIAAWSGEVREQTETLGAAIEALCYFYLELEHGGWENNEGAFGEFTLDVAARTVRLEFNARFSDYETHEHSF